MIAPPNFEDSGTDGSLVHGAQPHALRVLDLFAGCGAYTLGLEQTGGFTTVAFCENNLDRQADLARLFPGTPVYGDIRDLTAGRLAADGIAIDAIVAGFPCQDLSTSGTGLGLRGERSGLWFEVERLAGELRPGVIILENSTELLAGWIGEILGALAALGYDAEWECIPAGALGAHHWRDRVYIVAHAASLGLSRQGGLLQSIDPAPDAYREASGLVDAVQGNALPFVCGRHDGFTRRVAESGLHAVGNTNPPQALYLIGNAILQSLNNTGCNAPDAHAAGAGFVPFHDNPNSPEAEPHHGA